MKRILIIIGNYFPQPSSVANCAEPLINKLVQRGYMVDVLTERKSLLLPKDENIKGINVYRVDDYRSMNTKILNEQKKINASTFLKILTSFMAFILKGCYYITYCMFSIEKSTGGWQRKEVLKRCIELDSEKSYNAVISISQPFISHYNARDFVNSVGRPIKWFMFEFDPFSYNAQIIHNRIKRERIFADEYNMFKMCDKVFLTQELHKYYKNTPLNDFSNKLIPIPFANMQPVTYNPEVAKKIQMKEDTINCIFAGRFYDNIRNPAFALKFFMLLNFDVNLILISNYGEEKIKNLVGHVNDRIVIYSIQTRDTVFQAMKEADILINIGNTVDFQVPGKIFEYMSTGKPIVHFSKMPNDPAMEYFQHYPIILIIKEWENNINQQLIEFKEFCQKNAGFEMSYEEVCTVMKGLDSESVSEDFFNIINNSLEDKL